MRIRNEKCSLIELVSKLFPSTVERPDHETDDDMVEGGHHEDGETDHGNAHGEGVKSSEEEI